MRANGSATLPRPLPTCQAVKSLADDSAAGRANGSPPAMTPGVFADNLKLTPYWWDDVPRPQLPEATPPAKADVVVIGSGYTGLCAALQTARGGRHTVVLDAQDAGWGCSTRNGGQISTRPP